MKLTIVAGARPNFIKIAPIIAQVKQAISKGHDLEYRLVHTGQHYDKKMSGDFFDQLEIPHPHANLEAGGGSQAEQTANIMVKFEKELLSNRPDLVVVVGDVTSTLACSIAAKKLCIKVAHVEGGIRSGDITMPEEINRIVTDSITDYFFTTSEVANQNLRNQGISEAQIHFVGNTMIDTLRKFEHKFAPPTLFGEFGLEVKKYLVLTLHRPANVDDKEKLEAILKSILESTRGWPVIFPVHPRTAKVLEGVSVKYRNLILSEPLGYLEFNYLVKNSFGVITDSGGITEETTVMGVPCMTLRDSTERPETVTEGTNVLIGYSHNKLRENIDKLFSGEWKKGAIPALWDGKAAERIVNKIIELTPHSQHPG